MGNVIQLPGKNPEPDSDVARDFLGNYLAASGIHLVAITPDATTNKITGRHFGNDAAAATVWATEQNQTHKRNIYWTANMVKPGTDTKPTKADITGIRVAHVDIDPPRDNPNWDKPAALADIMLRGNPSVVIDSGNGLQALWWLSEQTDAETIEAINRGVAEAFDADHCQNVDRLLRLPGTVNWPDTKKQSLGRVPVQSSIAVPFTGATFAPSALSESFPDTRGATLIEALPDGPDPRWTLSDKTDEEIIRIMLAERPNIAASFGQAPTMRDIWEGTQEALDHYNGDASALDMAAMSKIAFYAGKWPSRMLSIFEKSPLSKRDKWNRESYRNITIGKAVSGCTNVYSVSAKPATDLPGVTTEPVLEGEILPNTEFLTLVEQKKYFAGCVYVASEHAVLTPSGALLKPERFRAVYGGYMFEIGTECAPEKNAFIALTENRLHRFPKVESLAFNPSLPFGHIEKDAVNIYMPHDLGSAGGGTIEAAQEFFQHFVPDEEERKRMLKWIAAKVRKPDERLYGVIMQGALDQGSGRGLFFILMEALIGAKYCQNISYAKLAGREGQGQYEDWRFRSLFAYVEEAQNLSQSQKGKEAEYEMLKLRVDPSNRRTIEITRKGLSPVNSRVFYSTIIATNHADAIWLDSKDRRFDVISNGERMPEAVREAFAKWLDVPANIAAFAEHLAAVDLSDFDPFRAPPMSTAKAAMIEGARSDLDRATGDAIDAMTAEIFTLHQIATNVEFNVLAGNYDLDGNYKRAVKTSARRKAFPVKSRDDQHGDQRIQISTKAGRTKIEVYAKNKEAAERWRKIEDLEIIRSELSKNGSLTQDGAL